MTDKLGNLSTTNTLLKTSLSADHALCKVWPRYLQEGTYGANNQSQTQRQLRLLYSVTATLKIFFFGLAKNLPNKNVAFFIQSLPVKTDPTMNKIIDYVSRTPSIKIVVINASWASRGLPESEISKTLQELINAGKKVFIGDDRPFFADPSTCKYGVGGFGLSMYCTKGINYETSLQNSYLPKIHDLLKKFPALHFLPMFREFCNSKECSMIDKQEILYRDWTHLNISGSVYLWNKLFINPKIKNEFIR